ncbi:MAG: copper resistance protein CopC, partial [Clostridioides difficile]|jgi:methionine-rich copper-binding protein CopC|nr:copper resistance protein CopC [Klebsiella pneumoniae]MDU4125245.1 copper resistance protein CopC [Clostridioides difficile]
VFAGKKSAQIREILISESAWEEMTCLFAPSLTESPKQLALSFTESLEPSFSKAELKNADGHIIPAGKPALDPKDKATLIVPVSTTLDKGQYEVDWTALSVDGHKTQGKYTFTVK